MFSPFADFKSVQVSVRLVIVESEGGMIESAAPVSTMKSHVFDRTRVATLIRGSPAVATGSPVSFPIVVRLIVPGRTDSVNLGEKKVGS